MKQFALLIKENVEVIPEDEEIQKMEESYIKWMDDMIDKGNYVSGSRLSQTRETLQPDGEIISDGPYVETKEMIGGIVIIQAKDTQQALELARTCPMHQVHNIDLREISHVYDQ